MLTLELEATDDVTGQSARFRFTRSPVRIGRSPLCELCLERDVVSSVHAVVYFAGGDATYVDLGSRGGSHARGQRLDSHRPFALPIAPAAPATIVVGPVTLALRLVPASASAPGLGASAHGDHRGPGVVAGGSAPAPERAVFSAPPPSPRTAKAFDAAAETHVVLSGRSAPVLDRLRDLAERQAEPDDRMLLAGLVRVATTLLDNTLALRRGVDGVSAELGLPRRAPRTPPFDDSTSPAVLWQHLLGEPSAVGGRVDELARLFTDAFTHDVALLGALRDGVKALVDRLHPAASGVDAGTFGGPVLDRYTELFERETDDAWSSILGADFAASYARAMSGPPPPASARVVVPDPMTVRPTAPHRVVDTRQGSSFGPRTPSPLGTPAAPMPAPGAQARLVGLAPELGPRAFVLSRPDLLVGRADDCDIQLMHPSVSRHHARLALIAGAWRVTDLDSANGILVNKQPRQAAELHDGDVVEFGEAAVRFEAAPPT